MTRILAVLFACALAALAQSGSTIRFVNGSGETCTVKLVGPTTTYVTVHDRSSNAVNVSDGNYRIVVRHGDNPRNYRYSRGQHFSVQDEAVSITLHRVANGNYSTRPASEREFD